MLRTTLAILALAALAPAHGARIFKCEGADGSVTFTTTACPDNTTGEHYATYTPQPDAPAVLEAQYGQYAPAAPAHDSGGDVARMEARRQMDIRANERAVANADPRHPLGQLAADAKRRRDDRTRGGNRAAREAAYEREMARLYSMAQGVPLQEPAPARPAATQAPHHHDPYQGLPRAVPPVAAHTPPATTTSCKEAGGRITCTMSDGTWARGQTDAAGNTRIHSGDRTIRAGRQADGTLRTSDGTCIRDVYGQCK